MVIAMAMVGSELIEVYPIGFERRKKGEIITYRCREIKVFGCRIRDLEQIMEVIEKKKIKNVVVTDLGDGLYEWQYTAKEAPPIIFSCNDLAFYTYVSDYEAYDKAFIFHQAHIFAKILLNNGLIEGVREDILCPSELINEVREYEQRK